MFGRASLLSAFAAGKLIPKQEKALWATVVSLEEAAVIVRAEEVEFSAAIRERLNLQAERKMHQAARLREIIEQLEPFKNA
jgi:hypothetical protein